jgi:cyclic pyranopterin phosphate synthase
MNHEQPAPGEPAFSLRRGDAPTAGAVSSTPVRREASHRLVDGFGRRIDYLRLSVIDRCNLRCRYCMPADPGGFVAPEDWLTFDDIVTLLRVATSLGVERVRLTGGEPLLRPDLDVLISRIRHETDIREIAVTTNGIGLEQQAPRLAAAGLRRLNVSVDSLQEDTFRKITRRSGLDRVWRGIDAARRAGIERIHVNNVVMADLNDHEIDDWVEMTRHDDVVVRFLEVMPIGEALRPSSGVRYVDVSAVRSRLIERWGLEPVDGPARSGPARYWAIPGSPGRVGFITAISDSYCGTCNRFRMSATGVLRPCLAWDHGVPLRAAIRARDVEAVAAGFREAARVKPAGHHWGEGHRTEDHMFRLGG